MTLAPRIAVAADIAEILRLGEYMYASVGGTVDDEWRALGRSQLESRLGSELLGWVIDDESVAGRLAACGFVNRTPRLPLPGARTALRGYVQWVVTDPAHQRRGHARAIMARLMRWAQDENVAVLDLNASPSARALYLELGFVFSPNIDYPPTTLGAPMQWRVTSTGVGPARPSGHVGGDA
ncbi:GNAT family N-acetyltransferase [Demequina lutea]|uniref:GNAT superfamily N-acetyltransferase n=1 Tax=Demequina lutea TaxID=431489 RepID=A0A7Y9ZAK9_9MICO|nr:GNAT family N-acetyltransferase [Demequina lutea]NYI41255.1 GNAT superfamily N-acetyltransferase [Demequina lutea]